MFKITIEKSETVISDCGGDWEVVEKRPYTKKEMEDVHNPPSYDGALKSVYGNTPIIQKPVKSTRTILVQSVDSMDLTKVIKAINNIE